MNARLPEKKIDSIRIDTGAKRIEVNDDGEYITLNFADQSLPTRFFAMLMSSRQRSRNTTPKPRRLTPTRI